MSNDFCFSILALGTKYQILARKFAETLKEHSPKTVVVVGTDSPHVFQNIDNVIPFKLRKRGILHCYHDKLLVIEEALTKFETTVQIDADAVIVDSLPKSINPLPGLLASRVENLVSHVQKYNPERLTLLCRLADKLQLDINTVSFVHESLFAVSGNDDKTSEFIRQWNRIARYLELHGVHAGEGNAIGLAAAKAKLKIIQPGWLEDINQAKHHIYASKWNSARTLLSRSKDKMNYHYRFNKARIVALRDFEFYYR